MKAAAWSCTGTVEVRPVTKRMLAQEGAELWSSAPVQQLGSVSACDAHVV